MLNILLIQDDAAEAAIVRQALINCHDASFRVVWVRHCADGLKALTHKRAQQNHDPDRIAAILVDLALPDSRGMQTFDRLFAAAPHIPILILTSPDDEVIAKAAIQKGAHEYLLKGHLDDYLWAKAVTCMIDRAANAAAIFEEKERAQVTLNSIGDAVVSTDVSGDVTYLNVEAERLTGWSQEEAKGHPLLEVLRIIDGNTRGETRNPMAVAIKENRTVTLTPDCILIRKDGTEFPIEDSSAPIHDRHGQVTGAVMVFHDVSAARSITLRMSYLAQHDSLTQLPNRLLLIDRLTEAIAIAQRHNRQLAVLFLDIDRFKFINDSLGHATGDQLLQSIAGRVLDCVRASDTVSRLGGDEFVILLPEIAHSQDALICADKILEAVRRVHRIDEHDLYVTASIGVVTYPEDGTECEVLMKHADFAMYDAKEHGRDNRQGFNRDLSVRAIKRHSLENDVRHALEREEFRVHYQPKVALESGKIVGMEALIRWLHPVFGLVPPADFIPVAEECGLIVPIGRWVLDQACHQAQAWQEIGIPPLIVAVNISAVQLRAKDFLADVARALANTGLRPQFLELELTETFLMQDTTNTSALIHSLKDLGLTLALDDFGTGYSSLSYLKRFPIDTLKIDRSFVRSIDTNADDASIVSAVISMGKNLHMRVVAEGVETREQLDFLQERGCPFGQGYYFSPPLAGQECIQVLRESSTLRDRQCVAI
ncbi:MAG: EAL domain-containing protein [Pseudomonadota bacterium]|nr:EAL domain-containing protein [Pseudomonadota bacterium]